jgi:hypothetical protein
MEISWTHRIRMKYYVESRTRRISYIHVQQNKKNASWIGHIWRRNCLLNRVIEGKIERIEVRGKLGICKQLLVDQFLYKPTLLVNSQETSRGNSRVCAKNLHKSPLDNRIHACPLQPK